MIFSEQHRQMLAVLAPYLEHEIEVETRAHGRGTLVGLPFCQAPCEKPRAEVRLHSGGCDEVLDLADVKPVLWMPFDIDYAVTAAGFAPPPAWQAVARADFEELQYMAEIVDTARAMGLALNLDSQQFARRYPTHKERDAA
jgi:hypothetical protein